MRLVLDQYVAAEELATDGECSALIERLGWAIVEAEELERGEGALMDSTVTPRGSRSRYRARGRVAHTRGERQPTTRPARDLPAH